MQSLNCKIRLQWLAEQVFQLLQHLPRFSLNRVVVIVQHFRQERHRWWEERQKVFAKFGGCRFNRGNNEKSHFWVFMARFQGEQIDHVLPSIQVVAGHGELNQRFI